jgi:hypothetical protein
MFDFEEAQEEIAGIIGTRFVEIGRIGRMVILGFGGDVAWQMVSRAEHAVGSEYALHVSCPFRLTQGSRLVIGSGDIDRRPASSSSRLDGPSDSLFDRGAEVVAEFIRQNSVIVRGVKASALGDLVVEMDFDSKIELFIPGSSSTEAWRFLVRFGDHYVFPDGPVPAGAE